MACEKFQQFAIVRADTAQQFEDDLNRRLYELRDSAPEVKINDSGSTLTAQIKYTVKKMIEPEPHDYERDGIVFTCADCPHYEAIKKKDGTPDLRAKYGECKFSEFGRTYPTTNACGILYQEIRNGGIRLCLSDSE